MLRWRGSGGGVGAVEGNRLLAESFVELVLVDGDGRHIVAWCSMALCLLC